MVFSAARFFERGISRWRPMIVTGVVFAIDLVVASVAPDEDQS